MALTAEQTKAAVKLGVAAFGAPISTYTTVFEAVLNSAAPFGGSVAATYNAFLTLVPPYENVSDASFASTFVDTLLGDSVSAEAKTAGKALVETLLAQPGATRGSVALAVIEALDGVAHDDAVWGAAAARFDNRVTVAEYYTTDYNGTATDVAYLQDILDGVGATTDVSTPALIEAIIQSAVMAPGESVTLTNGTDVLTANIFNAPMVYTPDGGDRILSLQDEDVLTGTAGRTDNTLNATVGQVNADEGTSATVTPTLNNIQILNFEWTGNTKTVDVRYADAVTTVNVNKITAAADDVTVQNISTPAANLRVANANNAATDVSFDYLRGVLAGTSDVGNIKLDSVLANSVEQDALSSGAGVEGFETVNLSAANGVELQTFSVNQMQNLNITGSGLLDLVNTTEQAAQYTLRGAGGIANPGSIGLRNIDATAFTGELNIDITAAGAYNDPANSGKQFFTTVKGGKGDDTFWANGVTANATTKVGEVIDGGEGVNTLKLYTGDVANDAAITNIQTLELRTQAGGSQTVDFDAFRDTELTKVLMRSEQAGGTYNLNDIGADLASGGGLVLRHSADAGAAAPVVNVTLKADTATDTVAITVENDRNTGTTFDYTINADVLTPAGKVDGNQGVENLTINDNDTESNVVTLTESDEHVGTVTLTGGVDKQSYTVASKLEAVTVDASTQLSDLRLTVGNTSVTNKAINQTIKLGEGDDILTFADVDSLDGNDTVTDAGGVDTLRAAFSKNPASVINLTDIEKFHIAATNNVTLDMAKASTVSELAILSDQATNGSGDKSPVTAEPFNLVGNDENKVITLKNTALTTLNFFGDNDTDDVTPPNQSAAQRFNGVTLENNSEDTLTVAINSSLDPDLGALSYTTGQLTTHGVKTMTVTVGDEVAPVAPSTVSATTTNIKNIWDRDLETFTASTKGSMTLGTVSGNALGNNIKTFDVSAVQGNFSADVVALGDAAVVTLAAGQNTFNALGSSGKLVTITSFAKNDTITGTAQDDTINSGAGNDTVNGDRGNNVMSLGAGDDVATAKDGNNTVSFGTGTYETATINDDTGLDASKATNVFTADGSAALISIDSNGAGGQEVIQMIAVGDGSALRVEWTGSVLNESNALLDGTKADTGAAAVYNGTSGANFVLAGAGEATTFNGGDGNDVLIVTDTVGAARTFSGGAGNDAFVGLAAFADIVTGGTGADRIVLTQTGAAAAAIVGGGDRVIIADGDSTAAAWDQVYGFNAGVGATAGEASALDLVFTTIAANTAGTNGTDAGKALSHAITSGIVTFDDQDAYAAPMVVSSAAGANNVSLADALAYLAVNLNGTSATVAFTYDRTGDGVADDTIVFQDGAADTVVQLVGVLGTSLGNNAGGAAVAGQILIV